MNTYDEPPTQAPAPQRRLVRTEHDKVIGGVAGGIGQYFGFDPVLARIGFAAATALGGAGIVLYIAAWLLVPSDDGTTIVGDLTNRERRFDPALIAGALALIVGLAILTDGLFDGEIVFGLALIAGGIYFVLNPSRGTNTTVSGPTDSAPLGTTTTSFDPGSPGAASPGTPSPTAPSTESTSPESMFDSAFADTDEYGATGSYEPTTPLATRPAYERPPNQARTPRRKQKQPRSPLGLLTIGTLMLYAGVLVTASTLDWFDVNRTAAWAGALGITGAALVASAWFGRARGLIFLGIVLAMATGVSTAANFAIYDGAGERNYVATDFVTEDGIFELGAGELDIDMSELELEADDALTANLSFGELVIDVPADVNLVITTEVRMGELEVFDQYKDGPNNKIAFESGPAGSDPDEVTPLDPNVPTLTINAFTGFGRLEINR